jgi:hypothetical protein
VYRAIIKDVLQRPILVGTANADYTPLDQISPYLRKCVLTTEDPLSFLIRVLLMTFKQSIVKNIKPKILKRLKGARKRTKTMTNCHGR